MLVAYKIYDQTLKMGDVTMKHLAIEFKITQITVYKMSIDCIEPTAGSVTYVQIREFNLCKS